MCCLNNSFRTIWRIVWILKNSSEDVNMVNICRMTMYTNPANRRRWAKVVLMLGLRQRRWANNKTTLAQRLLFTGKWVYLTIDIHTQGGEGSGGGGVRIPPLSTTCWQRKWEYIADFAVISAKIGHFNHSNLKLDFFSFGGGPRDPPPLLYLPFQTFLAETLTLIHVPVGYLILSIFLGQLVFIPSKHETLKQCCFKTTLLQCFVFSGIILQKPDPQRFWYRPTTYRALIFPANLLLETFIKGWLYVGPTLQTVGQHLTNIRFKHCYCWFV